MTVVNFETGEIIEGEVVEPELTADQARALTDEIRQTLRVGHTLIIRAFKGRAWTALGYKSWDDYCSGEFNEARMVRLDREQRREIVAEMRQSGMSTRSIASGLGVSAFPIREDLAALRGTSQYSEPERVIATDGRSMPSRSTSPTPAPVDPVDRAYQEADVVNAFRSMARQLLKPKNVDTLTPKARTLLIELLEHVIEALAEERQ